MTKALIFDIQRFSLHDGPGIRTLVFFKGCSLQCQWCSNPEGISFEREIRQNKLRCAGCGSCLKVCPIGAVSAREDGIYIDRRVCDRCGTCVAHCGPHALTWWGEEYTVEELYARVKRDTPFYSTSSGGLTLGGGDPLLQNGPAVALLRLCRENGINTAVETAGNYPWQYLENAVPYCDTIHFDIKGWSPDVCQRCTGADNSTVLDNLRCLDDLIVSGIHKPALIVRLPIIPGYNYSVEDAGEIAVFLKGLKSLTKVELLPFHNLGEPKYKQLGKPYRFEGSQNLREKDVEEYRSVFAHHALPVAVSRL